MTMSGESIIDDLKKGVLDSVHRDLKEYLSPLLFTKSCLPTTSLQRYAYTAARFLHAAVSSLNTCPENVFQELVDSVHLCCQCITETQQYLKSPKDPLAVAKLICHIIKKLIKEDSVLDVVQLSEFLHTQMKPLIKSVPDQQATIVSIAGTTHAMLWNIAVKNGGESPPLVLFQTYTLALKFYSMNLSAPHLLVQKAILVINLHKNLNSSDSGNDADSVALAINLFDSVVCSLKNKLEDLKVSSLDYDDHLHALLEIQQFEIRHFSNTGKLDLAEEICQIGSEFLNEVDAKKGSIVSAYRACCRLLEASFHLDSISAKDCTGADKKKLASDITTAVKLIRFPSALGPRTYFSIVESLLQLKVQIESTFGQFAASTCSVPESLEGPLDTLLRLTVDVLQEQKCMYLDQVNSAGVKGAVKKLQTTVSRIVDVLTSLLYMQSGIIKSKQRKVSNADCSARVDGCLEVLKTMKDVLDEVSIHGVTAAVVQRYHILIYVAYRLGVCFYDRELYKEAITFYELAVESWENIKNDTSQQGLRSLKETRVWIIYVFTDLSDNLRRTGQTEKAMSVLVQGFLADQSRVSVVAEAWCRCKRQVMKLDGQYNDTIKLRTLHQGLLAERCDLTNVNVVSLMEKELHFYVKNNRMADEALAVITELLHLVTDPEKRANTLMSKAQQLWMQGQGEQTHFSEQCQCLDEAIVLLNRAKKRGNSASGLVLLGKAFLWKYIFTMSKKCLEKANRMKDNKTNMNEEESSETTSQESDNTSNPTSPQTIKSLDENLCDLMTLRDQNELLVSVDKALEYCTKAYRQASTDDTSEILEVLNITQAVYALTQNPIKELHCLATLSSLLKQSDGKVAELLRTQSRRVIVLTSLRQFEAAGVILDEMIALEKSADLIGGNKDLHAIHVFLLTQAELYLVTGKVPEGFALLEQVNELKTRLCMDAQADRSLLGWFHRLLAQYLALPLHQFSVSVNTLDFEYGNATSPLFHLTEAAKHHSYVVLFLIGWDPERHEIDVKKHSRNPSLVDQWTSLDNLLTSLDACATVMVRTGEVRHATYYLKEGLDIAVAFSLPKRCIQFLLGKTKLQALQHQLDEAKLSLQVSHRILNFPDGDIAQADQDGTAEVAMSPRKEKCFGFDFDEEADGATAPDSTSVYHDVPQPVESCRCPPDCTCSFCEDIVLLLLRVDHYLAYSETFSMVGYPATDDYFTGCHQLLANIQAKVNVCFTKLHSVGAGRKKDMKAAHESADFCLKLSRVKLCIQHCHSALSTGSREFSDWAHKALDQLTLDTNPDMVVHFHLIAHMFYLFASRGLQQFQIAPVGGAVDDLVDKIALMQLESEESEAANGSHSPDSNKMREVTTVTPAKQMINNFKTPGNKTKKSISFQLDEVPSSVPRSRRKALDLLMASSDEEDASTPPKSVTKTRRKTSTAKRVSRKKTTEKPARVLPQRTTRSTRRAQRGKNLPHGNGGVPTQKECASIKQPLLPSGDTKEKLLRGFDILRHFPSVVEYRSICQGLALCSYGEDPWETAYYLCEAMNSTIRHQHIMNSAKKRRRLIRDKMDKTDIMSLEHVVTEELLFCKHVQDMKTFVSSLPAEWVVCQLSVLQIPANGGQLQLFLTRLEKGEDPVVVRLPGFTHTAKAYLSHFEDIVLNKSKQSMEETNAYNWWTKRKHLCDQLKQFVNDIENDWFGSWKGLLLGQLVDDDSRSHVESLASKFEDEGVKSCEDVDRIGGNLKLLELLLGAAHVLQKHQVPEPLRKHIKKPSILRLVDKEQTRQPVILVLDRLLQRVPFECMPVIQGHPVSRMFSFHNLSALLTQAKLESDNIFTNGVDPDRGFFVLNPDGNLARTEQRLLPVFAEYKWPGISGVKPSQKQYKTAVSDYDLFLYSGHGCGRKYLACDTLQTTKCHAASLLFGCSSAALKVQGVCEGTGTIQHYFLGGAYCVLGNLWDITDKDIDIFAEQLLSLWLKSEPGSCLQDFISAARETCKLRYLVGSAPVCYGLPVKHI